MRVSVPSTRSRYCVSRTGSCAPVHFFLVAQSRGTPNRPFAYSLMKKVIINHFCAPILNILPTGGRETLYHVYSLLPSQTGSVSGKNVTVALLEVTPCVRKFGVAAARYANTHSLPRSLPTPLQQGSNAIKQSLDTVFLSP